MGGFFILFRVLQTLLGLDNYNSQIWRFATGSA